MKFEFDEASHIYTVDGRRVLHNTEVLAEAGFCNYWFVSSADREAALKRGKDVHKATHLLDRRKPWKEFSHYAGYVEAWKKFKKEFKFTPLLREVPYYDPDLDCATTLDAWGKSKKGLITVEIKTGHVEDWTACQTAFEERAALSLKGIKTSVKSSDKRWAVELRADGTWIPRQFPDPTDLSIFISALNVVRWRRKHGQGNMPQLQPRVFDLPGLDKERRGKALLP